MRDKVHDLEFHRHGLTFHYRYVDRGPGPLFVCFPSLRPAGNASVMYFSRLSWAREISCSCLFVADPMLQWAPEVRGTCFLGRPEWWTIEHIVSDLQNICAERQHPLERVLLYGSSQGANASLHVGAFLQQCPVVVEHPQINMRLYQMPPVREMMARACFDLSDLVDVPARYEHRLNVVESYRQRGSPARITVFVRESDQHHLNVHVTPFVTEFPHVRLRVMGDRTGTGHSALDLREMRDDLISALGLEFRHSDDLATNAG